MREQEGFKGISSYREIIQRIAWDASERFRNNRLDLQRISRFSHEFQNILTQELEFYGELDIFYYPLGVGEVSQFIAEKLRRSSNTFESEIEVTRAGIFRETVSESVISGLYVFQELSRSLGLISLSVVGKEQLPPRLQRMIPRGR